MPGFAGQRQRGARADGGGAARGLLRQQAPVGAVVELVVVSLQRAHGRDGGAGASGIHRGERPAGGVGVVGLRPGTRVQREPAVGRAGQRLHRVVHQRPDRALAGQPPQRRRGRRRHVTPPQARDPDDHDVPHRRARRGLRARRARGENRGQHREQAGEHRRPHRTRPHRHRPTVSGVKPLCRTIPVHVDVTALALDDLADQGGGQSLRPQLAQQRGRRGRGGRPAAGRRRSGRRAGARRVRRGMAASRAAKPRMRSVLALVPPETKPAAASSAAPGSSGTDAAHSRAAAPLAASIRCRWPSRPNPVTSVAARTPAARAAWLAPALSSVIEATAA